MHRNLLLLLAVHLAVNGLHGQQSVPDSGRQKAVAYLLGAFHRTIKEESPLYNGTEHIEYDLEPGVFAYFQQREWWPRSDVLYDGILYRNISAKFDLVKNVLVIQGVYPVQKINLFSEKVEAFFLNGHTFLRLQKENTGNVLPTGFYEQLCNGPLRLLVSRKKIVQEYIYEMQVRKTIAETNDYYAQINGVYHPIRNNRALLDLTGDRKKEIQKYLKRNNIKYKKNPEGTLVQIANQYNQSNR